LEQDEPVSIAASDVAARGAATNGNSVDTTADEATTLLRDIRDTLVALAKRREA
jgi:hypothetical protein